MKTIRYWAAFGLLASVACLGARCDEEKVTICHVPEGNPSNPLTLEVGAPGADWHLEQHEYDYPGPCTVTTSCPGVGEICGENGYCCDGLSCNSDNYCVVQLPMCAGPDESCDNMPCCEGTCNQYDVCVLELPECVNEGEACNFLPCCEGYTCSAFDECVPVEVEPACVSAGQDCTDLDCCDGLYCSEVDNRCVVPEDPTCGVEGCYCDESNPCCHGFTCEDYSCVPKPPCCTNEDCDPGQYCDISSGECKPARGVDTRPD